MPAGSFGHGQFSMSDYIGNDGKSRESTNPFDPANARRAWWLWFALVFSDYLIAASYFAIPLELLFFWYNFGEIMTLNYILPLFIAFITLCGTTHIASAVYDDSRYNRAAYAATGIAPATFLLVSKVTTGIVSFFTAVYTVRLVPQFLRMPGQLDELQRHLLERVRLSEYEQMEKEEEIKSRRRIETLHQHLEVSYILRCTVELIGQDFSCDRATIVKLEPAPGNLLRLSLVAEHRHSSSVLPLVPSYKKSANILAAQPMVSNTPINTMPCGGYIFLSSSQQVRLMFPFALDVTEAIIFPLFCHSQVLDTEEQLSADTTGERPITDSTTSRNPSLLLLVQKCFPSVSTGASPAAVNSRLAAFVPQVQNSLLQAQYVVMDRHSVQLLSQRAKQLEIARRDAEKASKVKSEFISTISHEIRTPMQAITALSDYLLEQDEPLHPTIRSQLETIRSSAAILSVIVNDILDLSRFAVESWHPDYKPCVLRNLVEEAITVVFAHQKLTSNIEMAYVLERGCPREVLMDATRIMQVLVNLIHNAVKNTETGSIVIRVRSARQELHFSVKDTGIGIPPHLQGRLFKKFAQIENRLNSQCGGVGLGLAICRKIVEKLSGRIWIYSSGVPGEGSEVSFCLPEIAPHAATLPPASSGTVLLVDISKELLLQLVEQFDSLGIRTIPMQKMSSVGRFIDSGSADSSSVILILIDASRASSNYQDIGFRQQVEELNQRAPVRLLIPHDLPPTDFELLGDLPVLAKPIRLSFLLGILQAFEGGSNLPGESQCAGSTSVVEDSAAEPFALGPDLPLSSSSSSLSSLSSSREESVLLPAPRKLPSLDRSTSMPSVLVVEDHVVIQRVFKTLLSKLGVTTIALADTGVKALEVLARDPSKFQFILMDINMPEMDGVTCTGRIISEYGQGAYHIVGVSAASSEEAQNYLRSGMDDFVAKPAKLADLKAAIEKYQKKKDEAQRSSLQINRSSL